MAAFESEPDAEATAIVLRENGFDAEVLKRGAEDYEERTRDFFQGRPHEFAEHAILVSNADRDTFMRNVQRHYGTVIRGEA